MTSTLESPKHSPRAVRRAAVIRHGRPETVRAAVARVEAVAREHGVELVPAEETRELDLAVVLGGDGTMLRTLQRFLGKGVPVIGVNFGRVGFLSSMSADQLEPGLARAFAGDYVVFELPTLEAEASGERWTAVNDVVALSGIRGRMVELAWTIGGEELGSVPCDGVICATPSGSTAYNLSNGGPVLIWGLDAMAISFVAPHSLHARPLVVPRGAELRLANRTAAVPVAVLADGHDVTELGADESVVVRLGPERTLLASLPEQTFFRRYREKFA